MTNPMIRIIDGDTVIDREMTDAEAADYLIMVNGVAAQAAEQEAAQAAQAATKLSAQNKLAALGLTEAEIQTIIGN